MVAPRVILHRPTHRVAVWRNVIITSIEGDVDAEGVRGIIESYLKLHESHPRGIVGITLLQASLKVGTMDTNAEAKRGMGQLRGKLLHVSIVIEDQGVLASLLRAIIRTLNSIARSSILSISADLEAAVRAVAPHVEVNDASSPQQVQTELLQAMATVRAARSAER
jgi:hypothetical protein